MCPAAASAGRALRRRFVEAVGSFFEAHSRPCALGCDVGQGTEMACHDLFGHLSPKTSTSRIRACRGCVAGTRTQTDWSGSISHGYRSVRSRRLSRSRRGRRWPNRLRRLRAILCRGSLLHDFGRLFVESVGSELFQDFTSELVGGAVGSARWSSTSSGTGMTTCPVWTLPFCAGRMGRRSTAASAARPPRRRPGARSSRSSVPTRLSPRARAAGVPRMSRWICRTGGPRRSAIRSVRSSWRALLCWG